MRANLLSHLEVPIHKNLTSFMFYDVLMIMCRYTCETSHKLIKQRRRELATGILLNAQLKGYTLTPA